MAFSEKLIQKVWEKGRVAQNNDPDSYRKDEYGAWIKRDQFDADNSELSYGWTIDLVIPESKGGKCTLNNLKPIHWENSSRTNIKRNEYKVTSDGVKNMYEYYIKERQMQS
jgi:hypothetical protein